MTPSELLLDSFGRLPDLVHAAVDGLTADQLRARVDPQANTIGWLVWHLTRVQDDHVARAFDVEQLWTSDGWQDRFGLPFEPADIGYGHSPEQVAAVRVDDGALLTRYTDAVVARSLDLLRAVTAADLDRVVDRSWDPPVTLGVRLVSVLDDDLQHVGQAAFVRGLLERAGS
jgi:hypothetical protein